MLSSSAELTAAEAWLRLLGRQAFPFQQEAWRAYLAGESGLINAPTGTGKTLSAWLGPVLEARQKLAQMARLPAPRVLWITPLRALANDLLGHLREPLAALQVPWSVEIRTGDT